MIFLLIFFNGCEKKTISENIKEKKSTFFCEIPIVKYTSTQVPCIAVKLEGKEIISELDLGCCGCLHVTSAYLSKIKRKFYTGRRLAYGVKGTSYQNNLFFIERLSIGNWSLFGRFLLEDGYGGNFEEDSILFKDDPSFPHLLQSGRIGWRIFKLSNLLLDTKNSKIVFCDSLETAQKHGYFLKPFCSAPLLLDRGIIELKVQTSWGELLCGLDTGSTLNILNNKEVHEIFFGKTEKCSSFSIGGRDLGPIEFYPFSIQLPIHVEAILGMDFFFDHLVFIDFHEKQIFISPYPKEDSKAENI